jgi:hypothetical protein
VCHGLVLPFHLVDRKSKLTIIDGQLNLYTRYVKTVEVEVNFLN